MYFSETNKNILRPFMRCHYNLLNDERTDCVKLIHENVFILKEVIPICSEINQSWTAVLALWWWWWGGGGGGGSDQMTAHASLCMGYLVLDKTITVSGIVIQNPKSPSRVAVRYSHHTPLKWAK